jgi:hypothetical protein
MSAIPTGIEIARRLERLEEGDYASSTPKSALPVHLERDTISAVLPSGRLTPLSNLSTGSMALSGSVSPLPAEVSIGKSRADSGLGLGLGLGGGVLSPLPIKSGSPDRFLKAESVQQAVRVLHYEDAGNQFQDMQRIVAKLEADFVSVRIETVIATTQAELTTNQVADLTKRVSDLQQANTAEKEKADLAHAEIADLTGQLADLRGTVCEHKVKSLFVANQLVDLETGTESHGNKVILLSKKAELATHQVADLTKQVSDLQQANIAEKEKADLAHAEIADLTGQLADLRGTVCEHKVKSLFVEKQVEDLELGTLSHGNKVILLSKKVDELAGVQNLESAKSAKSFDRLRDYIQVHVSSKQSFCRLTAFAVAGLIFFAKEVDDVQKGIDPSGDEKNAWWHSNVSLGIAVVAAAATFTVFAIQSRDVIQKLFCDPNNKVVPE